MTIQVTITHTNPGYPKNVRVAPYTVDDSGKTAWVGEHANRVIKGGESVTIAVYGNTMLSVEETEDQADSDKATDGA